MQADNREYNLFIQTEEKDSNGFYRAEFVGNGKGNINTGSMVLSNTTTGLGNLTGYIHPQKVAIFQLVGERNVFVSTDGCSMVFQNIIGKNDLTFIQGFIEYILQRRLRNIEGNEYQGIQKKKAYVVSYTTEDGQSGRATMTNKSMWDSMKSFGSSVSKTATSAYEQTKDFAVDTYDTTIKAPVDKIKTGDPAQVAAGVGQLVGEAAAVVYLGPAAMSLVPAGINLAAATSTSAVLMGQVAATEVATTTLVQNAISAGTLAYQGEAIYEDAKAVQQDFLDEDPDGLKTAEDIFKLGVDVVALTTTFI